MSDLAQTEFDRALGLSPRPARENVARLRSFVTRFAALREDTDEESEILQVGRALLADLIAHDDWLPEAFATHDSQRYQEYLLHCDSAQRFSVVSNVWGPGQSTPVHDHTVWGLFGVLRGAHLKRRFTRDARGTLLPEAPERLATGAIVEVSPTLGDILQVSNAHIDRVSISIHVYGANIGTLERHSYDASGRPQRHVSGYANRTLPNIWAR